MLSSIRIGLFAVFIPLLCAPVLTFGQNRPEPLPPLDSLDLSEMHQIAGELSATADMLKGQFSTMEEEANALALSMENQFSLAKLDSTSSKPLLDSLSKASKSAKSQSKKLTKVRERSVKAAELSISITMMDSLNTRKNLPKAWQQVVQLYDELYPLPPSEKTDSAMVAVKTPKPKKEKKEKTGPTEQSTNNAPSSVTNNPQPIPTSQPSNPPKKFAAYSVAADVMLTPPSPPCLLASTSRDEFSGEVSKEMTRSELFRFTNPALRAYLQGKTHVICEASIASTGPNATLLLTFTINDPNARKAFGRLDKNSVATLKFIDGSTFMLQNAVPDDGVFNPETGATIFRAQYPVSADILKKMRRTELDKLRIAWSNGYDDYEVQQVDLLMRQVECLFK
jgi:hypothetical protein